MDKQTHPSGSLHEEFASRLASDDSESVFTWISRVLESLPSVQRASSVILVAYTGSPSGLSWLENNVASPVKDAWGIAAALLGAPWPRIESWLSDSDAKKLMALDTLRAYRVPEQSMAPLHQIAAPTLQEAPTLTTLDTCLSKTLATLHTPRVEAAVASIRQHSTEILGIRTRNVAVADMPNLYLNPLKFQGAASILEKHENVASGIRESVAGALREHLTRTRH
jgi:hypothetical protein